MNIWHIFFKKISPNNSINGINWGNLFKKDGPYIPKVSGPDDTSAFQRDKDIFSPNYDPQIPVNEQNLTKYAFLGFTYKAKKRDRVNSLDIL